ncbi:MAG: fumarylacetoacetate hydrolase family protein [Acidimicrobiales bacterium]|nr:fumarylacetoacetate hydrolase family protein [Acidimicrobiales bacterium]
MNIGRFEAADGDRVWGVLSADQESFTVIQEPMASWAPKVAEVDDSSVLSLGATHDVRSMKLVAPVETGARIFGTGVNYPTHLEDSGPKVFVKPETMPGYIKLDSSVVDPGGVIRYPATTNQLDYEIEILMVVAKPIVPGSLRTSCLLGYTIGNDVSPRDVGKPTGGVDLYSMKAQDQTAPIGPWITTLTEFGGPGQPAFDFTLKVNGELRQHDNTKNMIWNLEEILTFINERNRVRVGDLVFTGTTGGTGMRTGNFLKGGDHLELWADHIGTLVNTVGEKEASGEW